MPEPYDALVIVCPECNRHRHYDPKRAPEAIATDALLHYERCVRPRVYAELLDIATAGVSVA